MPFKKVENCNQVVRIGKQLKFSLVNVAGNDIVQGNKKLILGMIESLISTFNFFHLDMLFYVHKMYGCVSSVVLRST